MGKARGTKAALMREMAERGEFAPKLPARVGRKPPVTPTVELLREACERFSKGETLKSICLDDRMPDRTNLWRFTLTNPEFEEMWATAKALHAELLMEETGAIADREVLGPDGRHDSGAVQRDKLRIEQRHLRAASLDPQRWGRTTTVKGDADNPIVVQQEVSMERRAELLLEFLSRAQRPKAELSGFGRPAIEHQPRPTAMTEEQWDAYVRRIASGSGA
jgi:hypothetical protein